jgi:kynurenine formamidase
VSEIDYAAEREAARRLATLSNWGRWGTEDERGLLNAITPEDVSRAAGCVRRGTVYPLGDPVAPGMPGLPGAEPRRVERRAGPIDVFAGGPVVEVEDGIRLDDIHGATTHIDALCHVGVDTETLYNGFPARFGPDGAAALGSERIGAIVTRGILVDVARHRGVEHLGRHDLVDAADLEAGVAAAGVELEPGDAVLVRTGWRAVHALDPAAYNGVQPGVGPSAALLLAERDVALLGVDNTAVEALNVEGPDTDDPRARAGITNHLHPRLIGRLGMYLVELLDLDALAADGALVFLLSVAPLRLVGMTGAPVNPVAIA